MTEVLDARGLICPLPVLKARKKLMSMAPGAPLCVLVTDVQALKDFPLYCAESGHEYISSSSTDNGFTIRLCAKKS